MFSRLRRIYRRNNNDACGAGMLRPQNPCCGKPPIAFDERCGKWQFRPICRASASAQQLINALVGRTNTIVRLQTGIRRKNGTENFGGFVYVWDLYNGILCRGFLCARLIQSLFSGYHTEGYHVPPIPHGLSRPYHHCTAITPVYIYPGYHAIV